MPTHPAISPVRRGLRLVVCAAAFGAAAILNAGTAQAAPREGAEIYRAQCASCHGPHGEGTDKHREPLAGDRSIRELAGLIERTMPEDDPEQCVGEEAQRVAEYIHETFYSPIAQARRRPPRIELSRLTVRQFQQTLADLAATFRPSESPGPARGLKGEYFRARKPGGNRELERVDPRIEFDFGIEGPTDKFDPREFSIRWEGSLLAPETAEYEFVVRSRQSVQLWVNRLDQPLIDGYVRSGNDEELRGTIRLLAGRSYPLRLQFSKSNQGVNDAEKAKNRPVPPASVALCWRLPRRGVETVPERCLSPQKSAEGFVCTAPFPPDDRSDGYERGTSLPREWDQAATAGALELADWIAARPAVFLGPAGDAAAVRRQGTEFCLKFAERAFRRPLSLEEQRLYVTKHLADEGLELDKALKRSLLSILKSPRFLLRNLSVSSHDPYEVAARLSFAAWDSLPDAELLRAAAAGELAKPEQVAAQAERMAADPRTGAKLREFFLQWLKLDQTPDLAKDREKFPDFTAETAADLRESLELFLEDAGWGAEGDFRRLLGAERVPLNERLAKFYGVAPPSGPGFQTAPLDAERRAGVLTHPYLLAHFAYSGSSSPIHRGAFLSRSLLGRVLKTPPEAVAPLAEELAPDLTTRERIAAQTKAEACARCHAMVNPLGFAFEHFDAVGRFRTAERGKPIDASGTYLTRAGREVKFADARQLADYLAESDECQTAFVEQLFHHLVKQPIRAYGDGGSARLREAFQQRAFRIRGLTASIVGFAALPPLLPSVPSSGAAP